MLIAETIVPWASEWLFYYEIWKGTGEWYGGGDWPPLDRSVFRTMAAQQGPIAPHLSSEQGDASS